MIYYYKFINYFDISEFKSFEEFKYLYKQNYKGGIIVEKKDKTLTCKDCGAKFEFTVGEQEFFELKGLTNEPCRCADCRKKKKAERNSNRRYNDDNNRY